MPIRHRLALVFGVLGLLAVASVSTIAYVLAAQEVRSSIDDQLRQRLGPFAVVDGGPLRDVSADLDPATNERLLETTRQFLDDPSVLEGEGDATQFRLLWDDGTTSGGPDIGVSDDALASLTSPEPYYESATIDGRPYRIMSVSSQRQDLPVIEGRTPMGVQLLRDVSAEEGALDALAVRLALLSALAVAVVGGAGLIVGRWLARPITELSDTAETLADLEDLPRRVELRRNDELGQMAASYNRLLSAIEVGREQQRRLVADASHELRTPLTGLRMRLEYLQRESLDADRRRELLAGAVEDAEQLSALASDLVDLAAAARSAEELAEESRLDDLTNEVVDRVRRRTDRDITVSADDSVAIVRPTMIRRALQNLLDNAVKYAPDGPIEVVVTDGRIEVRDHGDGIAEDDLDHVFDRFFRSPKARNRPGNGIGLAIVRQVAEAHEGDVWARSGDGGGAVVGFSVAPSAT